jgi:hypothetical protein
VDDDLDHSGSNIPDREFHYPLEGDDDWTTDDEVRDADASDDMLKTIEGDCVNLALGAYQTFVSSFHNDQLAEPPVASVRLVFDCEVTIGFARVSIQYLR